MNAQARAPRSRATDADAKLERRNELLDAAEVLLSPDGEPVNIAELAERAGVAKGTVYLYFPSKEALLLALYQRTIERFFDAFDLVLGRAGPLSLAELLATVDQHLISSRHYCALAGRCLALVDSGLSIDLLYQHKLAIAERLRRCAQLLASRLSHLSVDQALALVLHSHALVVGLWQMLHPVPALRELYALHTEPFILDRDYRAEINQALRTLWAAHVPSTELEP